MTYKSKVIINKEKFEKNEKYQKRFINKDFLMKIEDKEMDKEIINRAERKEIAVVFGIHGNYINIRFDDGFECGIDISCLDTIKKENV